MQKRLKTAENSKKLSQFFVSFAVKGFTIFIGLTKRKSL
jgi:hypothetical protein